MESLIKAYVCAVISHRLLYDANIALPVRLDIASGAYLLLREIENDLIDMRDNNG